MIIDSHAHYAHNRYRNPFRCLTWQEGYAVEEATLEQLMTRMEAAGIRCSIEPGISIESNGRILELCRACPGRLFPAVGAHPTRAIGEKWRDRKRLVSLSREREVIAIGETGLDYHYKREEQHRLRQYIWFLFQLDLAWRRKLPLILHVRDAHADALRILRRHPARKNGGVIHCFTGTREEAREYGKLGFYVGIGGALLQPGAEELRAAVAEIPVERILLETDAPYVLPYCKDVLPGKVLRRTCNSSLVLPAVAREIGRLKGIPAEEVERITAENTIRLFSLPIV